MRHLTRLGPRQMAWKPRSQAELRAAREPPHPSARLKAFARDFLKLARSPRRLSHRAPLAPSLTAVEAGRRGMGPVTAGALPLRRAPASARLLQHRPLEGLAHILRL